jgi:hypothetical protein
MAIDESRIPDRPALRQGAGEQFLDRQMADRYNFTSETTSAFKNIKEIA